MGRGSNPITATSAPAALRGSGAPYVNRGGAPRRNEHGLIVEPGRVMYHVTEGRRRQSVDADGLQPSAPAINAPGSENPTGVYLFADLGDLLSYHLYEDLEDPVVYAVNAEGLALHGDPDWINDQFPYANTAWYTRQAVTAERVRRVNEVTYDPFNPVNPDPFA